MEDENKTPAPAAQESAGQEAPARRSGAVRRRRRPGTHRSNGGEPAPQAGQSTPGAPAGEAAGGPAAARAGGARDDRGQKRPPRGGRPAGPNGREEARGGEKKNRDGRQKSRRSGGQSRGPVRQGLEDLYGTPTEADVMSLEDLRARIVLKAADGSVPAAPAAAAGAGETDGQTPAAGTEQDETVEVVGIRFRSTGKVYSFDPRGIVLHYGEYAVVETARGPEFGEVCAGNRTVSRRNTVYPLRPVLRRATPEDIAHNAENRAREKQAMAVCQEKIRAHRLQMKLIDAQYAFDNSQLLFYFTSENRVDFRALVKDLAAAFHTRIELRQIGIRDEAKMLGGLGACGRPLCCTIFLSDVVQVSIRMAKEQNLALNSAKISGICGRLMCCLRYEADLYAEELRHTPPYGSTVQTADGVGTVIGTNPLAGSVRVLLRDTPGATPKQYSRDAVTVLARHGQDSQDPSEKNN